MPVRESSLTTVIVVYKIAWVIETKHVVHALLLVSFLISDVISF